MRAAFFVLFVLVTIVIGLAASLALHDPPPYEPQAAPPYPVVPYCPFE